MMTKRLGDHRYHLPEPRVAFVTDYLTPAEQSRKLDERKPAITLWDVVALALVIVILALAFAG